MADRIHRAEVYSPAGRWVWGQWIRLEGFGTSAERLQRTAQAMLSYEPRGSSVHVFEHKPFKEPVFGPAAPVTSAASKA